MLRKLHALLLVAFSTLFIVSCGKDDDTVASKGAYDNGYFILNEGYYGTKAGDLSFYSYTKDSISFDSYQAANSGTGFATTTTTPDFAGVWNGKIYTVTNYGGPLTVADAYTLKESARNAALPANGHAFLGIDNNNGLLSTDDGVYPVTLSSLAVGTKISGVDGDVSNMIKSGNYVFVLSAASGIVVLKASDYSVAKVLGAAIEGFAAGKDGKVYAANSSALLKIDPSTLAIDTISFSFSIRHDDYVYKPTVLSASTKENAVYLTSKDDKVYRYVSGDASSLSSAFITLPAGYSFYGAGIGYDAAKNTLVATATTGGEYGNDENALYTFNAANGALTNTITYTGYYFPAMVVFH